MKGWKIVKPFELKEEEIPEQVGQNSLIKVKITKALVTLDDVLMYRGEDEGAAVVLGSAGVGVVSESKTNLFGLEKGSHVYIEPVRQCNSCYMCKNKKYDKCTNLQTAGCDFNGFLSDFTAVEPENLFLLPECISDLEALFIEHISLALSVVDKLNIQKGDYVAIMGGNNLGNILAQLLIYYQAVPILITADDENMQIAKDSGIYYVLGKDDNWQKEVSNITGGRMPKSIVNIADCNISAPKVFALAGFNTPIAFIGSPNKNTTIPFAQAIKKQLDIHCISSCVGNTASSINLIANKAINLTHLKLDTSLYQDIPSSLEKMSQMLDSEGKIYEMIVDIV